MGTVVRQSGKARWLWRFLPVLLIGLSAATPPSPYQAGQIWEYHTRPGDEGSLLKIQSIERDPAYAKLAPIYHITVIGVHLGGVLVGSNVGHLPVSSHTLDVSVTRLHAGAAVFPSADEGIAQWRREKGGVFTISVAEIVAIVDQTIGSRSGSLPGGGANQK